MRFKKSVFRDIKSSITQRELTGYTRIAKIEAVDSQKGVCTISWLDRPGGRVDVLLTQSDHGSWNIPERGAVVLVGFDVGDQARILRYINLGHENRIKKLKSLPKLKEGEKFWEAGGSYIYLQKNGDIVLSTLTQGYLILEAATGTLKVEAVDWKVLSEAGSQTFGLTKRFVQDGTDKQQRIIENDQGEAYVEYNLKVVEKADSQLGPSDLDNPLIDITLGTYIDSKGEVVDKDNNTTTILTNPQKALDVKITLKSGVELTIDKEGNLNLKGVKLNINQASVDQDHPDVAIGLEVNDASLGDRGQHVAREHDRVTIPIGPASGEQHHKGLSTLAQANLNSLALLATAIMSPSGPCTLNKAVLVEGTKLEGEITEGAKNIYIGDK
jgi:hypothetical protein